MNFTKTMFALAVGSVGIVGAMSAHAAAVNAGDTLTINAGVTAVDENGNPTNVTVSWFGMDTTGNGKIAGTEKVPLSMGTTGIIIGSTSAAGASHPGPIAMGDTNAVTAPWGFFGNTGSDYITIGITGSTEAGLNFSGWTVTWNGIAAIPMGGGIQDCGTTSDGICIGNDMSDISGVFNNGTGIASFSWSGVYGDSYVLNYSATVPQGDPSGFGGVGYSLHLEGTVLAAAPVPEASTYGMMLAGLGLVGFAVRRRRLA